MMKRFSVILASLVLLLNLLVARPAFADAPKLDKNPDYVQLTQSLTELLHARDTQQLPEGISSVEELEQKITNLQYQKYIAETSESYGECLNQTGKPIAVYGPNVKKSTSTFDNTLYLLPAGEATDDDWSCQGVYLPNDMKVAGLNLAGAGAAKLLTGSQLVITENPDTGAIEFNLPPAQVFKAGEVNWDIPDVAEAEISRQLPIAPVD